MASSVKKKRRQKSNLLTDSVWIRFEEQDVDEVLALIVESGLRIGITLRLLDGKAKLTNNVERLMEIAARARASGHFDYTENSYATSVKQYIKNRNAMKGMAAASAAVVKKLIGERSRGKPKKLAG